MKVLALSLGGIENVFLDLWKRKACILPFTKEDFSEWCKEMPEQTVALVLVADDGDIRGGVILYPLQLPKSLFVQLMIVLDPGGYKQLEESVVNAAKVMGYDKCIFVAPTWLASGMQKLFDVEELGVMFVKNVGGDMSSDGEGN